MAALTLTLATLRLANFSTVVHTNLVLGTPRRQLIGLTLGAFAAAFAMGALFLWRQRERGLDALDWLGRLLCPLLLVPLLAALTQRGFASDIQAAVLLSGFVLGLERLLRVSFAAWAERPRATGVEQRTGFERLLVAVEALFDWYFAHPRAVFLTVVGLSLAHSALMSTFAIWQHQRFFSYGYDTGQYDQLFSTTLHGQWLAAPSQGNPQTWGDLAGSHADFIILPLVPIYALYPHATMLLAMQAVLVGTAAIPLYLFARRWLSTAWALVLAIAWLGYAPMHTGQFYGLHTQLFGAPFVMWAICAVEYKKWGLYWLSFALAISAREDVSMGLAALGALLAFSGHRFKTGLATAALATGYFFVIRFAVMPSTGFANLYAGLAAFGEHGFGAIIQTLISNPVFALKSLVTFDKLRFALQVMAPLAFLPVRRPALWLVLIPPSILTILTSGPGSEPMISITFQYVYNWVPYAFAAAAVALAVIGRLPDGVVRVRAAGLAVLVSTVLANLLWGAYTPTGSLTSGFAEVPFTRPTQADLERAKNIQTLMARVPKDSRLCTSDRIQAHTTSQHLNNWTLKDGLWDCEYLLWSDLPSDLGSSRTGPVIAAGTYTLVEKLGDVSLARRVPKPAP